MWVEWGRRDRHELVSFSLEISNLLFHHLHLTVQTECQNVCQELRNEQTAIEYQRRGGGGGGKRREVKKMMRGEGWREKQRGGEKAKKEEQSN